MNELDAHHELELQDLLHVWVFLEFKLVLPRFLCVILTAYLIAFTYDHMLAKLHGLIIGRID